VETVYLDTHVLVWLFSGDMDNFSPKAIDLIENRELLVSPMVLLELEYLHEIGRLNYNSNEIVSFLKESIGIKISSIPFEKIALESIKHSWTRDPFDRIIVANASYEDKELLTRDRKITQYYKKSLW
jgi:PIN domain nuclease of toxin-antitoxin system